MNAAHFHGERLQHALLSCRKISKHRNIELSLKYIKARVNRNTNRLLDMNHLRVDYALLREKTRIALEVHDSLS